MINFEFNQDVLNYTDSELLKIFNKDSSAGIELIFRQYYESLCLTAVRITRDQNLAEDIVQEVLFELYKRKDDLEVDSLIGYLKRAIYNRSLNKIKASKDFVDTDDISYELGSSDSNSQEILEYTELEDYLYQVIEGLPEKCRLVFVLNRFEQMSYKEVASKLEISVKTVENQMSKALRILRAEMQNYNKLEKINKTDRGIIS